MKMRAYIDSKVFWSTLNAFLNESVFPAYSEDTTGHGEDHIRDVMSWTVRLSEGMMEQRKRILCLVAAAYHDISITTMGRENHHMDSATMLREAQRDLHSWFSFSEIGVMVKAVEDHRASKVRMPRSKIGTVLSDADRAPSIDLKSLIHRTWDFRRTQHPEWGLDEMAQDMHRHIFKKYGRDGYCLFKLEKTEKILGPIKRQIERVAERPDEIKALVETYLLTGSLSW